MLEVMGYEDYGNYLKVVLYFINLSVFIIYKNS